MYIASSVNFNRDTQRENERWGKKKKPNWFERRIESAQGEFETNKNHHLNSLPMYEYRIEARVQYIRTQSQFVRINKNCIHILHMEFIEHLLLLLLSSFFAVDLFLGKWTRANDKIIIIRTTTTGTNLILFCWMPTEWDRIEASTLKKLWQEDIQTHEKKNKNILLNEEKECTNNA